METCPHCGSPGSFTEQRDGRCPICGMALPSQSAEQNAPNSANAGTLQPSSMGQGASATIAFEPPDPDDTNSPRGIDLIKPRELSPEYARRVTAAWQNTRSQFIDPKETIKSEKAGTFQMGDLNINSHIVVGVDESGPKDYELKEVIGEGAMGTVWSARQSSLNRDVAVKMPRGSAKTDAGRKQFISEVVVTGQLDHPNIVPIYDLGKDSAGELFYSMKRVEGRPWNELLENEELSLQENLEILMKVCDAIRFAHDRGVIHRDIKPHNIMVGQYGEVAVMDWGIALRLDSDAGLTSITRISPAGTPAYMAPEMATGSAGAIGPATDVYLLGAVLYEILTREPPHPPPYDSKNYHEILNSALLIAARNEIPPIKTGGELADIAYKALATDVEHRYQSVGDFQDALRDYHSHAESINLTERGEKLLYSARANGHATHNGAGRFDDFDRARFAFEEALAIWPSNRAARRLQAETTLAYANYAYEEGAYARGIALLSDNNPEHKDLLSKLRKARRRTNSLAFLLKAAVVLIVVGTSVFSFFLYQAWSETDQQRAVAVSNEKKALEQEKIAKDNAEKALEQEKIAKDNAEKALEQEKIAKDNAEKALEQEKIAKDNAEKALEQEKIATDNAAEAEKQRDLAHKASYVSEIGLAAEELQRNAFDRARGILENQTISPAKKSMRNWEWSYLQALVSLNTKSYENITERVEAATISADQKWIAAGTNEGDIYVWQADRNERPVKLSYGASVSGVAITADGSQLIAAGRCDGNHHAVKLWSLPAREGDAPSREVLTHQAPLLSLDLSNGLSTIATSTTDGWVYICALKEGSKPIRFRATKQENSIWCTKFSDDGKWIVTAGDDGIVRVWSSDLNVGSDGSIRESQRFAGGKGPVYAAALAPGSRFVVSGGNDGHLLAWEFDPEVASSSEYSPIESATQSLSRKSDVSLVASSAISLGHHDADVRSISFSSDGSTLYTAGNDHTIRVWDMADGVHHARELKTLRGHGGWVRTCVALPGDTHRVLSGGYDHRVQIWDWDNYSFPRVLRHQSQSNLGDLALSAGSATKDGQWIATASETGVITIWDMQDPLQPKPQELSEGHDWQATTAIYFNNGRRLLTAGGDNTALVWDEAHGNELVRIGGWNQDVGAGWRGVATVSSDGRMIATGANQLGLACLWDASTGEMVARIDAAANIQSGEKLEATALAFSPDGETLLIGDQWGTIYIARKSDDWRGRSVTAHSGKISAIEFLPSGEGFLTASYDTNVQEWRLNNDAIEPTTTYRHFDRVVALDLDSDGQTFITAVGSDDVAAVVRLWDRSKPEEPIDRLALSDIARGQTSSGEKPMVRSVSLHPSEARALMTIYDKSTSDYRVGTWSWTRGSSRYQLVSGGSRDLSMAVFAPHRGESMLTVGGRGARLQSLDGTFRQVAMSYRPQARIRSISFSADGQRLVSAGQDGRLKIWSLEQTSRQWKPEATLVAAHAGPINRVVCHPSDSDAFLTASDDGTLKLWQLQDEQWQAIRTLTPPTDGPICDVAFIGAGEFLAAGPEGVYIWGAGDAPRNIENLSIGKPEVIAISPDGKWLVIASDSQAQIVNATTLEPRPVVLTGHSAKITSMAFSPDGSRLFTAGRDFTLKVWNSADMFTAESSSDQRELLTLEEHSDEVTSVTVVGSEENPLVVTTGLDGQAIIWPSERAE